MKKILIAALLIAGPHLAIADVPAPTPTPTPTASLPPVSATALGDQLLLSLTADAVTVTEFTTNGTTKLEALDGFAEFGHFKGDYIAALDGGFLQNSVNNGRIGTSLGFHIHAIQTLNDYLTLSPSAAAALAYLQLTPRVSWDTDVHAIVWGATFGLQIPFQ